VVGRTKCDATGNADSNAIGDVVVVVVVLCRKKIGVVATVDAKLTRRDDKPRDTTEAYLFTAIYARVHHFQRHLAYKA